MRELKVRTKIESDKLLCYCVTCDDFQDCGEFTTNNRNHWGKHHYCKSCAKFKKKERENPENLPTDELELSRMVLTRIGYDVKSDISVHQQFLLKHQL